MELEFRAGAYSAIVVGREVSIYHDHDGMSEWVGGGSVDCEADLGEDVYADLDAAYADAVVEAGT